MNSDETELQEQLMEEHRRSPHPNLTGERLRLHVAIHSVVEIQVRDGVPPETGATLRRLMDGGLDRHEAAHAIGTVVADEMFEIMSNQRTFNEAQYTERLAALTVESWRARLAEMEKPD